MRVPVRPPQAAKTRRRFYDVLRCAQPRLVQHDIMCSRHRRASGGREEREKKKYISFVFLQSCVP